jgi:branched-chain amino acid transport system permease protein
MQILFNGLVSGLSIALLAVAFQLVYLPTRVFFFGLAGVYSATPFLAYAVRSAGASWGAAIVVATLGSVALCLLCEWANHTRLARRQASEGAQLLSSIGIYLILVQAVAMVWGSDIKTLRSGLDPVFRRGEIAIAAGQLWTGGVAIALLGAFAVLLTRSGFGLRLRALSDNPMLTAFLGCNVDRQRLLAFGLSGVFAAAASITTAYDVGFDPHAGLHAVLLAVVAVIIGGQSSFAGPIVGALLLGLIRTQVTWHWSARWQEAVTFALLAIVLLVRPRGLLGGTARLEASP